jgi:tetratricopeptide (TPR) repeat protein
MLPGPDFIYKCPTCGQRIYRGSLSSGNTFNADFFSDGKMNAPMLPEFPKLTICPKCNTIFWIDKAEKIAERGNLSKRNNEEFKACFLNIEEYLSALNNKEICSRPYEEYYIRLKLWYAFNDRVRYEKSLFQNDLEESQWRENCLHLIKMLAGNQKLIAELKRNLGEFEESLAILDNMELSSKPDWEIEQMRYACKTQNSLVFQFDWSWFTIFNRSAYEKYPFYQIRGLVKKGKEDWQGALVDFDTAILLNEKNIDAYIWKSSIHESILFEQSDIALECLDKAMSIDSNYASTYIHRALFFRHRKDYKNAQWNYEKAISLAPKMDGIFIVMLNLEDMLKYGKIKEIIPGDFLREDKLTVNISLGTKKWKDDISVAGNTTNAYFIFRKFRKHYRLNKNIFAFEFYFAKFLFYILPAFVNKKIRRKDIKKDKDE